MLVKQGDFLQVEYTGKEKESGKIFDTTSEKVAKDSGIYDKKGFYSPITVCLGKGQLLKGLEDALINKEIGKKYIIELDPEHSFGKKDVKLLKLISTSKFTKQGIKPFPGLSIDIDGMTGKIRAVTGGRTIVDFNHPLSGKDIIYEVEIKKVITDLKEKIDGILKFELPNIPCTFTLNENNLSLKLHKEFPKELSQKLIEKIKGYFPEINDVKIE